MSFATTRTFRSHVGSILQSARYREHLTVEAAAVSCGMCFSSYRQHEVGGPSPRLPIVTLQKLARGLRIEIDDLVTAALTDATEAPSNGA